MATRAEPGLPSLQNTLDALASPIRREILWLVWDDELPAGDIAAAFDVTAGTISTHLSVLREAGLVVMRADGNFRRYRADRRAMESVLPLLGSADTKWQAADGLPERALAAASLAPWVTVATEVPLDQATSFAAFAEETIYSQWLGVPVTIQDGRFSAEMEWGTKVRGHYDVVAPPDLIAMRWDFDDDVVPVPGNQLVGYLRFEPRAKGCHVEVHQSASDSEQAEFLTAAWSMVLGRFTEYAIAGGRGSHPRPHRPKRT